MRTHVHPPLAVRRMLPHVWPATIIAGVIIGLYLASVLIGPGIASYLFAAAALAVVAVTALARVNDITPEQVSVRWQARRLGLIMAGAGALSLALLMLVTHDWPTWKETTFYVGIALTWITTPHMPPWDRYITGKFRTVRDAKLAAVAPMVSGLDPRDDAPQYVQRPTYTGPERRVAPEPPEEGP